MNSWSRFGEDEVDIMVEEIKSLRLDRARLEWLVYRGVLPIKTKDGWRVSGGGSNPTIDWRDAIDQGIAERLKTKGEMNMSEQQNEVSGPL